LPPQLSPNSVVHICSSVHFPCVHHSYYLWYSTVSISICLVLYAQYDMFGMILDEIVSALKILKHYSSRRRGWSSTVGWGSIPQHIFLCNNLVTSRVQVPNSCTFSFLGAGAVSWVLAALGVPKRVLGPLHTEQLMCLVGLIVVVGTWWVSRSTGCTKQLNTSKDSDWKVCQAECRVWVLPGCGSGWVHCMYFIHEQFLIPFWGPHDRYG
jgi:hypothetical protein